MNNPFSLQGKTILVTGASSGIGKAIAIECSKIGARMIITGRNIARLANTFALLEKGEHKPIIAELTNEQEMNELVANLTKIDGIVHCAGIVDPVPFRFVNKDKLQNIFNINFFGPALLTQAIVKKKIIQKNASVVFISSISGVYCSSAGGSSYSATKGAINGMIKGMAIDLATKNIRVNSICPAMIETEIFGDGRISKEQLAEDAQKYPLKRYGKPEEVAYAAIYLLSDASAWVTGSNLLIDGGFTLL
jgi:NAD(P)-dependent dehydrogenase (short-subunit alcohol dehydrogenase family)